MSVSLTARPRSTSWQTGVVYSACYPPLWGALRDPVTPREWARLRDDEPDCASLEEQRLQRAATRGLRGRACFLRGSRTVNSLPACGSEGASSFPDCTPWFEGADRLVRTDPVVPVVHVVSETDIGILFGTVG
jgi:hypothetical protein